MVPRRLPSLAALRAFEAAARHLSAKRAAQELSVSATAISHQVRQLEESLGVALFVRKPRQLLLTREGSLLLPVLTEALDNMAAVVTRLRAPTTRQAVTLSTTPAVAMRWLLPWVCVLRDQHPTLDLSIHATHEPVSLDGVTTDMAIRYGSGEWPALVAEKLFDNVFVPVCSPALGLRDPAGLARVPLIHFAPRNAQSVPAGWSEWLKLLRAESGEAFPAALAQMDSNAGLAFSDETHAIAAVLAGQGVALMSQALVADELASGRLVQPFGPEMAADAFYLVYPRQRADDPHILAVRTWVMWLRDRYRSGEPLQCSEQYL
ncbi:LysR family transcriptional regulator [Alcanivorax sp. JB21]|nr:LysR substrate-binding domain-containing protein [Alcanivorax limicola]MBZ2187834.1 LysR family transcriptional regulator [Alcanivorax limicola]